MNLYIKAIKKLVDIKVHFEISSSDVVICEFPKSGVTYFSFLLANYLLAKDGCDQKVNFFNINMFVQDLHRESRIDQSFEYNSFRGRLLKTHALYKFIRYPQKIVLIRNPVKTMLSYYRHIQNYQHITFTSFDDFIRSKKHGISAWIDFYSFHLKDTNPLGQALFSFEDNISNPFATLKHFCLLTGISFCEDAATRACANTKLEKMAYTEELTSRFGYKKVKSRFVGSSCSNLSIQLDAASAYIFGEIHKSCIPNLLSKELLNRIDLNI